VLNKGIAWPVQILEIPPLVVPSSFTWDGESTHPNVRVQPEFLQSGLSVIKLLDGNTAFRRNFHTEGQFQTFAGRKLGKDLRVKVHPLLRWNLARPSQDSRCGSLRALGTILAAVLHPRAVPWPRSRLCGLSALVKRKRQKQQVRAAMA
jgi:hypothetical protein